MPFWSDLIGVAKGYLILGKGGVCLKNSSGSLSLRNTADSADAVILPQSLGTGTRDGTKFLRDDGVYSTPANTSFRNILINGNFQINQRAYASGAAVDANLYGHDRWKMAASGDTYTYSTTANVTTVTIPAGEVLRQVIEGANLQSGTHTLSWTGTAQGKIGAGSLSASGVTGTATGGTDLTIEFGPGTVSKVQLEFGSIATPFENRPIGLELALCKRYFQTISDCMVQGYFNGYTRMYGDFILPVTMRAAPTGAIVGTVAYSNATSYAINSVAADKFRLSIDSVAVGYAYAFGAKLMFTAEL